MRAAAVVRIEAIKTVRRPAVWVSSASLMGLLLLVYGGMSYRHFQKPQSATAFSLPHSWPMAIAGPGKIAAFFAAVVLVLLVTGEYAWKTARQNVIDGLSKNEFFAAKALTVPIMALAFLAIPVAMTGGIGALQTTAADTIITRGDALLAAGGLLRNLGYASLALMIAMSARTSGGATGLFFLWAIAEGLLGGPISHLHPALKNAQQYMPLATFDSLSEPARYGLVQKMGDAAAATAAPPSTPTMTAVAAAWIALFVLVSYVVTRERDL